MKNVTKYDGFTIKSVFRWVKNSRYRAAQDFFGFECEKVFIMTVLYTQLLEYYLHFFFLTIKLSHRLKFITE